MKRILTIIILFIITLFLGASSVHGQAGGGVPPPGGGVPPPGGGNPVVVGTNLENPFSVEGDLFDLLEAIVNNIILPIGGVLVVVAFIYSGFLYVKAQGNPTKISDAHKAFLATSIGAAILLGSWVIANVIRETINQILP